MDVIDTIRKCVATWSKGGESECRNIVVQHCNPNGLDILTTACHTLLISVLSTWSPQHTLSQTQFIDFVKSVLDSLPSSSSQQSSSCAATLGDYLVDMIWSVDAALDEVVSDPKPNPNAVDLNPEAVMKAQVAKQSAESDKESLQVIVRRFLELKIVASESCRERLDTGVLFNVGLIADKTLMEKKEIRMRTGLFYKQNKFNLLREQSEGYSKLAIELTSGMGPPHSSMTALPTETYKEIYARAGHVWGKVISLVGKFDLDPNRALDLILDVLSSNLATHHTFFLALLSFSPWAASYQRPSDRSIEETPMDIDPSTPAPASYKGKCLDDVLRIAEERSLNGGDITDSNSARVLSQVLGFKFAYYQTPEIADTTPKNLYLTTAILIREKFISLEDIYPHLAPSEEDMDLTRKEFLENVKSRIIGAKNSLLAMAAPLESGTSSQAKPKATTPQESKKIEVKNTNQKIGLLHALLSVGALRPAFAILSQFPWVVDVFPELADLLLRILKHSLEPFYDSMATKQRNLNFLKPRCRYGPSGAMQPATRKPMLTLWAPTPPSTNGTDFVFFFPDWADRIPKMSSLDDLMDVIEPIMHFIGVHVSRDVLFLTKFLRLGRQHLQPTNPPLDPQTKKPVSKPDSEHPIRIFWFGILRKYLIPGLSLIRGNAVCTVEIWSIIRHFPLDSRWQLYGEWKNKVYQSHPELRIRHVQTDKESKGILRRLSHNTIDTLSGPVAKLAHSNPCVFFQNAVHQIMSYDNLAAVVIQALRYVTNMGFDVLVFVVLDALANPTKPRVKDDGVNTADWLQSLASFTGMLFRRYSAELSPVLQYVTHQLQNGQTTEIVVLRELIWKMAGIEPLPTLSEAQIAAMAGGPVLRVEAIASETRGARLDSSEAILKGPQRLGRSLLESPPLALPLLIQVAQQRQACVFKAPDAHLKSLASLFDATHGVLLQYLELLTSPLAISTDVYATKILPSLGALGEKYGIALPICMQIFRPVWHIALLKKALAAEEQERNEAEEAEKRLKAALTAKREPSASSRIASPSLGVSSTPEATEKKPAISEPMPMEGVTPTDTATTKQDIAPVRIPESPWLPELAQHFEDIKKIAPGNTYDLIGPGFYLTFWQLSMYDLAPPTARYAEEGANLRSLSKQEDSKYIAADRSPDRTKRLTAATHRQRRDKFNLYANLLAEELKEQSASRSFTIKRLAREKLHWFSHVTRPTLLVQSTIEHCIQPRCLLSPMDADFCSQFIRALHTMGTPGFHTLGMYDKLLGDHVKVVLFTCSEHEARNYGRFLRGILKDTYNWYKDKQLFEQDSQTVRNGQTVQHFGLLRNFSTKQDVLKHDGYGLVFRKWHRKLGKSFIECIQTEEYMHVYNAIIVLKEILPIFPSAAVADVGPSINAAVDSLLEKEARGDLKILGKAYSASLKKREHYWAISKTNTRVNGSASQKSNSQVPEKPRNGPPTGPQAQNGTPNIPQRPSQTPSASTPSGPRASTQSTNRSAVVAPTPEKAAESATQGQTSSKIPVENIPRPEVVRRVRTEARDSPRPSTPTNRTDLLSDNRNVPTPPPTRLAESLPVPTGPSGRHSPNVYPDVPRPNLPPPPHQQTRESQEAPRSARPSEINNVVMPPPAAPSQTASAQELRESARQTVPRSEKTESQQSHNGSAAPSPRPRSPSPMSRPGTRNPSNESRGSGGRTRPEDGRRPEREGRQDNREHGMARRDSLTHNRSGRERGRERDGERDERDRDRDRGRDRHGHGNRDREKDKDRERDRERDRDRHRRDDKDRDRDRKESRGQTSDAGTPVANTDRNLPTRPDPRHRNGNTGSEESLGKRRRPTDDDPERGSKRSSRKESHRDERDRRPPEKDERERDSEHKRKERDPHEGDNRAPVPDKPPAEKKIPNAPRRLPPTPPAPPAPSAPRAMAGGGSERNNKGEITSGRDRHRDGREQLKGPPPNAPTAPDPSRAANSLRSRISEKEGSLSHPPPQGPGGYRGGESSSSMRHEDDRDGGRKRTASDREKDAPEPPTGPGDSNNPQSKRPRINRNRYNSQPSQPSNASNSSHGFARKVLPIDRDPSAGDRNRGRQD